MSVKLSKDDLDYIDSLFDLIDINQDGIISIKELIKCKQDGQEYFQH